MQIRHLFTNHVGHFILVTGLLDRLTDQGRVVMTSSAAHTQTYSEGIRLDDLDASGGYSAYGAYGQSKMSNALFTLQLSKKLKHGQTANAVHPGVILTNLGRHMNGFMVGTMAVFSPIFCKSIPQGAATQVLVGTHPSAAAQSGLYWADCNPAKGSEFTRDVALAEKLWAKTDEIVAGLA
jgi:NAD(P)-dependent dehydrogenase (short-subunit alcohol dehydrogenase family)